MKKAYADSHIHSEYSFDSTMKLDSIIKTSMDKNLKYIAITDHVEFSNQPIKDVIGRIEKRNEEIDELERVNDIKIIKGLEISEPHLFEEEVSELKNIIDTDYIIGSIHHIYGMPIKKMRKNNDIYDLYLKSMLNMVKEADIDTVAHFDYLKRYVDIPCVDKKLIEEILSIMIARDIKLEINTSGLRRCGEVFPSKDIIELYTLLGGKNITVGSDAHRNNEIGDNVDIVEELVDDYHLKEGVILKRRFKGI